MRDCGTELGYQLAPTVPYYKEYFPDDYQYWIEIGGTDFDFTLYDGLIWRPEEPTAEYPNIDYAMTIFPMYDWGSEPWVIMPLDENGNQNLSFLKTK